MWPFKTLTVEELKNKAFQKYVFKLTPLKPAGTLKTVTIEQLSDWSQEFRHIIDAIEEIVESERRFEYETFVLKMADLSAFMNKKSIDRAGWYGSQYGGDKVIRVIKSTKMWW